jgi:hypothetical protein
MRKTKGQVEFLVSHLTTNTHKKLLNMVFSRVE